jgi:PIN domain nuclease of toxin-antitoxin system
VRLLLDSNAFLWAYERPRELSLPARRAIEDAQNERLVSIASIWELSVKLSIGKLRLVRGDLADAMADLAATALPIALPHTERIRHLPFHHRDPFDRMVIAQAMEEGLTIVTRDRLFAAYGVPLLIA